MQIAIKLSHQLASYIIKKLLSKFPGYPACNNSYTMPEKIKDPVASYNIYLTNYNYSFNFAYILKERNF